MPTSSSLDFRASQQILALSGLALGYCPDALIFPLEEGAAGMSKQHFQLSAPPSEHEKTRARGFHRGNTIKCKFTESGFCSAKSAVRRVTAASAAGAEASLERKLTGSRAG
jgi:hypothetical protein